MLNIRDYGFQFEGFKKRRSTKRIILHHTDTPGDVSAVVIDQWHKARGWAGIGYHYLIRENGQIEKGRPEDVIGAHAGEKGNPDSIGIAVAGNFEQRKPTKEQIESLVSLIKDIYKRYGELLIIGHRDVMATACPGKNFPLEEIKRRIKEDKEVEQWKLDIIKEAKEKGIITSDHNPDEPATKWFVLAIALNVLKKLGK